MLVILECLYHQNAGTSGRTKTLGHLRDASQFGISVPSGGKFFFRGFIDVSQSGTSVLPECW